MPAAWEAAAILEECSGRRWDILLSNIGENGRIVIKTGIKGIFF